MTTSLLALFAIMGWAGSSLVAYKPNPDDPDPWPGPWPGPWPWWRDKFLGVLGGIALGYAFSPALGADNVLLSGLTALAGGIILHDLGKGLRGKKNPAQR